MVKIYDSLLVVGSCEKDKKKNNERNAFLLNLKKEEDLIPSNSFKCQNEIF